MFKQILKEIYNSLFSSKFRIKRFIAFLIVPFLYAFTFTYAFFNPFAKADQIPFQVITVEHAKGTPKTFVELLAEELTKPAIIKVGEMDMKIKMKHMYIPKTNHILDDVEEIAKDGFSTFYIPAMPKVETTVKELIKSLKNAPTVFESSLKVKAVIDAIKAEGAAHNKIHVFNNYKKNYILAFGSDAASKMSGKVGFLIHKVLATIKVMDSKTAPAINLLLGSHILDLKPIEIVSQMGNTPGGKDFAMYGFGLAPFFISIGVWISAIVASLIFNKKVVDKTISPTKRFWVKFFAGSLFVIVQSFILMLPLYFVGFDELPFINWLTTTFAVTFVGIIFLGIVLSIRFAIPNKPLGIFLSIILLVVQVVSSGGLFPIEGQSGFLQFLNEALPMGHSVRILRETIYETDVNTLMLQISELTAFMFVPVILVPIYHWEQRRFFRKQKWLFPIDWGMGGKYV